MLFSDRARAPRGIFRLEVRQAAERPRLLHPPERLPPRPHLRERLVGRSGRHRLTQRNIRATEAEERARAETAFAEARDCVIVSTSTLELGVDVGDLDRVIQINSPATVAAFLQRLGRSGRRPGTSRNALFLSLFDTLSASRRDATWRRLSENAHCFKRQSVHSASHQEI